VHNVPELAINNILVTGASGKLGQAMTRIFLNVGYHVRALQHRTPVDIEGVEIFTGSVTDVEAMRQAVAGMDVICHLATTKEDPATFFDVSVRGTFNLLEATRHSGQVKQFLLSSGDAVMGIWFYPQPTPIAENHPRTAYPGYYAFSKVLEEVMVEQYAIQYDLPISIMRSSWVFDKDDLLNHFSLLENINPEEEGHGFGELTDEIEALLEADDERIPILIDAEGRPYHRHIVHIDDVMQALMKIVGNPAALGQDFNIAAPAPFDYRVAAQYISQQLDIPTIEIACPEYHSFEIDITKACSVLGYAPDNDIFTMIDRAIAYRRENT